MVPAREHHDQSDLAWRPGRRAIRSIVPPPVSPAHCWKRQLLLGGGHNATGPRTAVREGFRGPGRGAQRPRSEDRPVRAAGAGRRVDPDGDHLVSGTVYGIAGGSVEDLGTDAAKYGRAGEESTGRVLDRISVESQRDVWLDLDVPARGVVANIDHILTGGTVALIIDAKRWRPGLYWTLDGTSFRWLSKVEHADRSTMPMIQQRIATHI